MSKKNTLDDARADTSVAPVYLILSPKLGKWAAYRRQWAGGDKGTYTQLTKQLESASAAAMALAELLTHKGE